MIHDPPPLPLQIPPLAGARLNAPEAYRHVQGEEAVPPVTGFPPVAPAGGNPIPSGRDGAAAALAPSHASVAAIVAERVRQIEKFGHTPAADAAQPLRHLPKLARQLLTDAIDDVQFHKPDWRKHARRHLVAAGAMILAALDRLDAEPEETETYL